jgi:hypothetical protein
MSAAVEILVECHARGIRIQPAATPGKLRLTPKGAIDLALLEKVREHKAELLSLLLADPCGQIEDERYERDRAVGRGHGTPPPEPFAPTPREPIEPAVRREIERIEVPALALGWRRERLWNFAFWPHRGGEPRGLASVMDPGDHVTEVTADFMLIEKSDSRRDRLRFWRTDG